MTNDSGPMHLDGDKPLTADERLHLRRLLREDDRMTWARKQLKLFVPALVATVLVFWQLWEWLRAHISWKP